MSRFNISYRKKCLILLALNVLLFGIYYKLEISDTLEIKAELDSIMSQNSPEEITRINTLKNALDVLSSVVAPDSITSEMLQQELLEIISKHTLAENFSLSSFPASTISTLDDFEVETFIIKNNGGFSELILFTRSLEKICNGKLVGVHFETTIDPTSKKKILTETSYIRKVKKVRR